MRFVLVTKRRYTNKDLFDDRFGRNFHLPVELGRRGHHGLVLAADYSAETPSSFEEGGIVFESFQFAPWRLRFDMPMRRANDFSPDVIIANGDIHLGIAGEWSAHASRCPFVYDLYDNYEAFASARLPGLRLIHRRTIRRADLVTCVSPALAARVSPAAQQVAVVGNGVDTQVFYPRDRVESRRRLSISSEERVAGYVGEISDGRGVDVLIQAVRSLRDSGIPARLVVMGVNSSQLNLDQPWITHVAPAAQSAVPDVIASMDVGVWPYLADDWGRYGHPNKLAEYLACGVPVVASDLPEFRQVAPYEGVSWYRTGDPEDLARVLGALFLSRPEVALPNDLTWSSQAIKLEESLLAL